MSKGIFFSIILFFLAATLVGMIAIQRSLVSYRREQMYIETRINAINNHYDSLIRDLGKTIEASTQRAIIACINNISLDFVPLQDANVSIKELVIHGTLNEEKVFLMENATIPYWVPKIEDVSTLKGFDVDVDDKMINETLVVEPYSSFYLLVEADIGINITDMQGISALNRTIRIIKTVSIEGLEDPLYLLYFHGLSSNYAWESPYVGNYTQLLFTGNGDNGYVYGTATKDTGNFVGKILVVNDANGMILSGAKGVVSETNFPDPGIPFIVNSNAMSVISEGQHILLDGNGAISKVWYIENLKKHIEGLTSSNDDHSYYQTSDDGPSYLDRLEGRYSIDPKYSGQTDKKIGLESFVDKTIFPGEISPDQERTNIDYLYFSSTITGNKIKGISNSNWFRIDDELVGGIGRQEIYNVTNLIE